MINFQYILKMFSISTKSSSEFDRAHQHQIQSLSPWVSFSYHSSHSFQQCLLSHFPHCCRVSSSSHSLLSISSPPFSLPVNPLLQLHFPHHPLVIYSQVDGSSIPITSHCTMRPVLFTETPGIA